MIKKIVLKDIATFDSTGGGDRQSPASQFCVWGQRLRQDHAEPCARKTPRHREKGQ